MTSQRVGLYDGFEGFLNHDERRSADALREGLVVPDTNVLLSLYKYNPGTRNDMLLALGSVEDRLWIPHQVLVEFWRNRRRVLTEHRDSVLKIREAIAKVPVSVASELERYRKITRDGNDDIASLTVEIGATIKDLTAVIDEAIETIVDPGAPTAADPVLTALAELVADRVQPKPSPEERDRRQVEGMRRVERRVPPGYLDGDKSRAEYAAGDFLVWVSAAQEAIERQLPLTIITADVKEDWWERSRESLIGPRPELVEEFTTWGGRGLSLLQPETFLRLARDYLQVDVAAESIANVRSVSSDWGEEAIVELLNRLDLEGAWQAEVLREAARNQGAISRSEIYAIAGRDESARLTGWTKPLHRVIGDLQLEGYLDSGLDDLMTQYYEFGQLQEVRLEEDPAEIILSLDAEEES